MNDRAQHERIGFAGLSAAAVVSVATGFVQSRIFEHARATHDYSSGESLATALTYAWYATLVASVVCALLAGGRRARGPAWIAAGALGVGLLAQVAGQVLGHGSNLLAVLKAVNVASYVTTIAALGALGVVIARSIAATGSSQGALLAAVACGPRMALLLYSLVLQFAPPSHPSEAVRTVRMLLGYGAQLAFAAVTAWLAVVIVRATTAGDREARDTSEAALHADWDTVANGITLYLVAVLVRVLAAAGSFAAMKGVNPAEFGSLHDARSAVVGAAVLGGLAGLGAIAGVVMIGRAPAADVQGRTSGVVALMLVGLCLDAFATQTTTDALSGNVGAAFRAMDTLPVVSAIATVIGVAVSWLLLGALAKVADALELPAVAERARHAGWAIVVAGGLGAVFQLAGRGASSEILLLGLLLVVPAVVFAAVQFLRVLFGIAGSIRARSAT